MIARPTDTMGNVIIRPGSRGLLVVNLMLTSLLAAPPLTGVLTIDPIRAWRGSGPLIEGAGWVLSLGATSLLVFGVLTCLTLVEYFGIRFFARRRRWRLGRDAAGQVCAHASVGWLAVGILPYVLAPVAILAAEWVGASQDRIDLGPYLPYRLPVSAVASISGYALGLLAGMTVFEWLVYLGVRRNRFANHASAARNGA